MKRPGHSYQAEYRKNHPEYEKWNREQQKLRNKRQKKATGSKIVNTDSLSLQSSIDGAYALMPITKGGKIVNTDALMVQLRAVPGSQTFLSSNTS